MKYWFEWNGVDCRNKGIILQEMPQIIKPEERVTHVTIPGRAGDVTLTEGDDIYESYIQTVPIIAKTLVDAQVAEKWLRGAGYVTFCNEDNLRQEARVIAPVTFSKHSRNSECYTAEVQFYCNPLKELKNYTPQVILGDGTGLTAVLNNPGYTVARPEFVIEGEGDIVITCAGRQLELTGVVSGWTIMSETEWVVYQGNVLVGACSGDFPALEKGDNLMVCTGNITKMTMDGKFRWL